MIDTVVFDYSDASYMFYDYWTKILNDSEFRNVWLPSLKQIRVLNANTYVYSLVNELLTPLLCFGITLKNLHLVFEHSTTEYSMILSNLIEHNISVHTMILEVQAGISKENK